jgi:putative membrane protein
MARLLVAALVVGFYAPARAQTGPWHMHDWGMGWGGGMLLGPLFGILLLALLIAAIFAIVRWLAPGGGAPGPQARTARDVLDERYARGEIDREEYLRRRQDISGE